MNNHVRILLTIFICLSVAAQGQQMTLSQAIQKGLENSKNLKLSKARVDIANAKYNEAVDATLPSLKVSGNYTRQSDIPELIFQLPGNPEPLNFFPNIPNTYSARASLSEVIFSGFRLKYAQASQKLLQEAVMLDAQKDSDDVVFNIVNAYYNIYKIKKSQEILADNLEQVKEHLKETQSWENQGIALHNDVLKWELQQSNVELAQMDLESNLKVANYNFNIMLGLNEDTGLEVDSASMFGPRDVKPLQDYLQLAAIHRGDLVALDARRRSGENQVRIYENSYYPVVSVGASYLDARPNMRYFPVTDQFKTSWEAGVTLTWDITNLYTNKHNVAEARANLAQGRAQTEILSDAIKSEVNQNYLAYIDAGKRIDVMQKAIVTAEENYRIMNNRYQNQLALQSDLLDADNALLQSRINLVIAKADAEIAYYKLLKSTGTIN